MRRLCLVVPVLALLAAAAPASGATVRVDETGPVATLVFEGAPGEANAVSIAFDAASTTWRVTDDGAPPVAGSGCTVAGNVATCAGTGRPQATIRLGDGNDRLAMAAAHDGIDVGGGDGDDQITLGPGTGSSVLHGDGGADVIHSDASHATLDYSGSANAVNVTIDGQANDGAVFERDNDQGTFEAIVGTPFADEIAAGTNGTVITGGDGTDTLIGGPGNDQFLPGAGNDSVYGAGGDDVARLDRNNISGFYSGGPGDNELTVDDLSFAAGDVPFTNVLVDGDANDGPAGGHANVQPDWQTMSVTRGHIVGGRLDENIHATFGIANGGRGNDQVSGDETLIGGRGRDVLTLDNPDTNVVRAADGEVDTIDCGKGIPKTIDMDPVDRAPGCGPAFKRSGSRTLRPNTKGYVVLRLSCNSRAATIPCRSKVSIANGSAVYARGTTAAVVTGESTRVRLKLPSRWKRAVAGGRKLTGELSVRPAASAGAVTLPALLGRVVIR